ncbi:MAG: VirB4 family type IV secretion system protein [Myxococcaceae bacterium]
MLRLDLFDKELSTAHHGLVVADTGSGKSVSLGALTLDALASGVDAILIDNGNSWKPLTELLGGIHLPVDLKTSLCPFGSLHQVCDAAGALDAEAVQDVVSFLEVCVHEPQRPGFDKLTTDLVSKAVRRCYEERFRDRPDERPVISDFRTAIGKAAEPDGGGRAPHPDDARIAEDLSRRLSLFVGDGLYAPMLDRPSQLRFDARLLTFDLQHVAKSPTTKAIAMATLILAVTQRAAARRRRTLVEVDEGHEHLGQDDVGERFLAASYRKMRKHDVAMWTISQRFADFRNCKAGEAIIGNSKIRIFLRHDAGHAEVAEYFRLSSRAAAAFRNLEMRPGATATSSCSTASGSPPCAWPCTLGLLDSHHRRR